MNTPCSVERLESALAGRLPSADETLLYQHLEECPACAASLECLAGGTDWSREAAALLKTDELDSAVPTRDDWSPIDFTVEHLEPTDEPNLLGRLGGYDILEIIGHGGMGVVLKAFDRELKRCVAIKVLAPHLAQSSLARKRFAREAQAAAAVVHPNVLAIHQVQPNGRLPFLVMPFVAGESLAQRLSAQGSLDLKEILRIGMQAAAGLAAAHEQGLVHRDVKPANILLEKGIERAVLTDFGLARAADDVTLTRWGVIAGTPQYMSPEQARGESLDNRSDLFSLGCVLYEMATGVSPFRTDSMMATIRRLVDDSPHAMASLNPELPPWFIAIVDRLLEKDPTKRFNTAKEVSDLLEGCLAHIQQPTSVPLPASLPVSVVQTLVRKFIGRYKGVLTMFAALAAGLFAVLMVASGPPDIAGEWSGGEEWGRVVLKQTNSGEYIGSYNATTGKQTGEIQLKWSRIESRFNGNWREGEDRFGELSVRLVDDQIRGALTTDAKSKINPATPRLADLTWIRAKAAATAAKLNVPWGDWNGGWSVRLRPTKTTWAVDELPEFTVDLRKRENSEPDAVQQTMHNWRLEVDGQRFNLSITSTSLEHTKTFEPGTVREGFVTFHLHRDETGLHIRTGENRGWINSFALQLIGKDGKILSQAKPEEYLKLTHGKHQVRIAFPASPVPPAGEPDERMALSNSVEIEIGSDRNASQSKANFGPVIERTMTYGYAIDFLSGRTMEWPEKWRNENHTGLIPDEMKWIVDAGVAASAYGDGLVGHGTVAAPCPLKFEDVTVDQVLKATADLTLEKNNLLPKKDGPKTLYFRTREGTKGILQIVDLGNQTTGLKLRYKLVQTSEQKIGEPLRVPVRQLQTEIKLLSIPYDEQFKLPKADSIELDWASVAANPQAVVFAAPRILALNGQECELETVGDDKVNPLSRPIIKIHLQFPTIDGQTIHYSTKLSIRSKQAADKGERTTTHELKHSGEAKLDQPQMLEIGRGEDNRRYLAWIKFHVVDASIPPTNSAHSTTFGPELERVVTDPLEFDDAKSLLLDTADWEKMTAEELAAKLAAAEKIDIRANTNSRPYVDLNVALAALIADGKPATPLPHRLIWGFKTPQGSAGILQVTGFTANPRGVKIRYKLVQQAGVILENHKSTARLQFRLVTDEKDTNAETLKRKDGKGEVRVSREVLLDETFVSSASALSLEPGWSVSVKFTEAGAKKLAEVTSANTGKQLAIVFDGNLLCAPSLIAAITNGSVVISGNFSASEAEALAKAMTTAIQAASAQSKPAAANPSIDPATPSGLLSEKTQKITNSLLANIDDLRIVLEHRPQDQPGRRSLLLSVTDTPVPDFYIRPRVSKEQLQNVLMRSAAAGFFDRAQGGFNPPKTSLMPPAAKKEPGYILLINGREKHGDEMWGGSFNDDLSQRDGAPLEVVKVLLSVLDGEAAKAVETILREISDSPQSTKMMATQAVVAQIEKLIKNAPVTTNYLAELFELMPGSKSEYRLRSDVVTIPIMPSENSALAFIELGKVLYLPANKSFFLQWDGIGSSTRHYYGPFYGEPAAKLGLKLVQAADNEANAVPVRESNLSPERTRTFNLDSRVGLIACSPDGKLIAVANDRPTMILLGNGRSKVADNWQPTIDVLDSETGKKLYALKLTTKQEDAIHAQTERAPVFEVKALAFSPDSKLLAVGTSIGQVKLFAGKSVKLVLDVVEGKNKDTHTPEKYRSLERALGAVTTLAFSLDGSLLAVGGESLADVPLLQQDFEKEGESLAISTTAPGRLKVWEVQTGKLLHDLVGHSNQISAVAFSPDGKLLASAGHWYDAKEAGQGVKLWDPASGELKRKIDVLDNGGARSVAFSPDSNLIAIGTQRFDTLKDTRSGGVMLLRVASGILDWSQTVSEWANPVVFSRSGEQVIVLSGGHSLNILETKTGKMPYDIHAKQERWNTLALVPQSDRLMIGGVDAEKHGIIAFWNLKKEIPQVRLPVQYSATKEQVARIEVLLDTSHTPITRENDPEVYELKPGAEASKQYQLRRDVVIIPIDIPAPAGNDTRKHNVYYLPAKRAYYIRWDDSGLKPHQCYGPYDEVRFHDFSLTPVFSDSEKMGPAQGAQSSQFGSMFERESPKPTAAGPLDPKKRYLDLDEGDFVADSPPGDLAFPQEFPRENHLLGLNLIAVEVPDQQWEATVDEVRKALGEKKTEQQSRLSYKSTGPTTYFFKTNFGSLGKLQLDGVAKKPGAVNLRFYVVSPTPMFGGYPNDGLDEDPEEQGLQGDWEVVSIKGDPIYRWHTTKVGDRLRIPGKVQDLNAATPGEDQYRVSANKNPQQFDVTFWVVNLYATQHGIYKLDGDNLTLCVAPCKGVRPTEFVVEPEKSSLFVLKRVTPAKTTASDSAR